MNTQLLEQNYVIPRLIEIFENFKVNFVYESNDPPSRQSNSAMVFGEAGTEDIICLEQL